VFGLIQDKIILSLNNGGYCFFTGEVGEGEGDVDEFIVHFELLVQESSDFITVSMPSVNHDL